MVFGKDCVCFNVEKCCLEMFKKISSYVPWPNAWGQLMDCFPCFRQYNGCLSWKSQLKMKQGAMAGIFLHADIRVT